MNLYTTEKHGLGDRVTARGHTRDDLGTGMIIDISDDRGYLVRWSGLDGEGDGWSDNDLRAAQ